MAGKVQDDERQRWAAALRAKNASMRMGSMVAAQGGRCGGKGIAPNKAAGSKGGIRRQGSKRG